MTVSHRLAWASLGLVAACGYRGGSFRGPDGPFPGERAAVGCLDVAVAPHADVDASGPVLAYEFGNRCDHPTTVDLAAVRVRARTVDGREIELAPYDPLGELRVAQLDARKTGREVIEYRAAVAGSIALACAELSGIEGRAGEPRAVCVTASTAPAVAEVRP
jgi:hypothetical protein